MSENDIKDVTKRFRKRLQEAGARLNDHAESADEILYATFGTARLVIHSPDSYSGIATIIFGDRNGIMSQDILNHEWTKDEADALCDELIEAIAKHHPRVFQGAST